MAGFYIKGAFSSFLTLPSRMDRLTLLAVLWAAAGTHTLTSLLMKNILTPGHLGSCGLLECGPHMSSPTPVWLLGSSNPVELTSPNFPNAFDASNLECEWVVKPRFGTKVSLVAVKRFKPLLPLR